MWPLKASLIVQNKLNDLMKTHTHNLWPLYVEYICKTQIDIQPLIDVQSSNLLPFLHFANRRPITSLTMLQLTLHPLKQWWRSDKTRFQMSWFLMPKKKKKNIWHYIDDIKKHNKKKPQKTNKKQKKQSKITPNCQ